MKHNKISTGVLKYRVGGNCTATCFLAGCQLFNKNLENSELKIFDENVLGSEDAKQELSQIIDWLNSQDYEYLIIDTPDEVWSKAKKGTVKEKIYGSNNPPYSVEDVKNLAKAGYAIIPSVFNSKRELEHAVLIYENEDKSIVIRDPEFDSFNCDFPRSRYHWLKEQSFDVFADEYFLDESKLNDNATEDSKEKVKKRFLIAWKKKNL